jgi:hypothetical protein
MVADLAAGKDLGAAPEANVYVYKVCRGFYDKSETLEGYKALPTTDAALIAFDNIYDRNPIVEDPSIINCSFEVEMSKTETLKKTIKGGCNHGFIIVVAAGNDEVSGTLLGNIAITLVTWDERFRLRTGLHLLDHLPASLN